MVSRPELGIIIPFEDSNALFHALRDALTKSWDRSAIVAYACENTWDIKVSILVEEFTALATDAGHRRVGGKCVGPI